MVLDSDLKQELNLIALSENMTVEQVAHIILSSYADDYWTEQKRLPKTVGFEL